MRIQNPLLVAAAAALLGTLPACYLAPPAEEPDDELTEPPRPASDVAAGGAVAPAEVPEPAPPGIQYTSGPNAALREVLLDQGWHRVGEVRVDGRGDNDRLRFARAEAQFTRLVFFADKGDIELDELTIVFADGSQFTPAFRDRIEEGTRTRIVRLPARHPPIDEIRFRYGTEPDEDAKLDVWGR